MFFERFNGIQRARGLKPASGTQPGAEQQAISFDKMNKQVFDHAATLPVAPAANEKSWFNSVATTAFNTSDVALVNLVLSKPERNRTT